MLAGLLGVLAGLQKDFNDAIEIPKSSKLHRYVNKVRKLSHVRYQCNNKRDPKIINLNIKMAITQESLFVVDFL